jgi:hypothetical protein
MKKDDKQRGRMWPHFPSYFVRSEDYPEAIIRLWHFHVSSCSDMILELVTWADRYGLNCKLFQALDDSSLYKENTVGGTKTKCPRRGFTQCCHNKSSTIVCHNMTQCNGSSVTSVNYVTYASQFGSIVKRCHVMLSIWFFDLPATGYYFKSHKSWKAPDYMD